MNRFTIPRDIYFSENALDILKSLEGKKALLVIGGGSVKENGNLETIENNLSEANIETKLIEGIKEEPSTDLVQEHLETVKDFEPDWIIGIGGGSPMDAAKAFWLFYEHPNLDRKSVV